MIERYFVTGARLKWTYPGADPGPTRDGSIIDSPPRGASPMIYDGLDGELFDFSLPNVSTLGMSKGMQINYSWLMYVFGHTAKRMLAAGDVLTGFMSGCLITQWTENGMRYVGHVGTVESSAEINTRVKSRFAAYMRPDTTGFNPAAAWDPGEIAPKMMKFKKGATPRIVALVTTGGEFYSLLMFELREGPGLWCVGGAKRIPPMNRAALATHLRT